MNFFGSTPTITEYWFEVKGTNPQLEAFEKAKRLNEVSFKGSQTKNIYGFAKAVFTTLPGHMLPQWHVRVLKIEYNRSTEWSVSDARSILPVEIKPPVKAEFAELVSAIRDVIKFVWDSRDHVVRQEEVERKLKKLYIYLLQAVAWPYRDANQSIEKVVTVFQNYRTCDLTTQNQMNFNRFVSQLSKHLHQQTMTLEVVCQKIFTKGKRSTSPGLRTFQRIRELMKMGTEKILQKGDGDTRNRFEVISVLFFARVFALHAYVYKPDVDNDQARKDLQAGVDRLVEMLVAYSQGHPSQTLFNFALSLMEHMVGYFKGEFPIGATGLASLVWTFESFLNNASFIANLQPSGMNRNHVLEIASALFVKPQTWHIIADFVVFLGDVDLFCKVLERRIDVASGFCSLDQNQVNRIFLNLNRRLREHPPQFDDAYKRMYLSFIESLMKVNKLHYLKNYAKHPDYQGDLQHNLLTLDFSFMDNPLIPLEAFFGNPSYRAIHNRDISHGMNVRRTVVRLFSRYGENPVNSEPDFSGALKLVLADFTEGYELLCEEILSRLGESTRPGIEEAGGQKSLIPVEKWLSTQVKGLYQALKNYVLMCALVQWEETFTGSHNLLRRFCLHNDRLYVLDFNPPNQVLLRDFFTGECLTDIPSSLIVSELDSDTKSRVQTYMLDQQNREAVSALTEAYMSLHNHDRVRAEIEKLIHVIFQKMKKDMSVTFTGRIHILKNFLHALAPFFKSLDTLVKQRFFAKGILKQNIVTNLIAEAGKIGHHAVGVSLQNLVATTDVNISPEVVRDVSQLVSPLCVKDIQDILEQCSLSLLVDATTQFENVVCRKVDELSYTPAEFISAFSDHGVNKSRVPSTQLSTVMGSLDIKDAIIRDYGQFLKRRPIPIYFVLPNQAIAVQLCLHPDFAGRNLLIKLGTGQGKSLVNALAALHEAKEIKDKADGRVFVFTSYDHLAKRDHQLGEDFFKKEGIKSICISTLNDVVNFTPEIKIIYADSENIDEIIREIMVKLLRNQATAAEKDFIKTIYGKPSEDIRVILDEYDLLLHDLEVKDPYVTQLPHGFLDAGFVKANRTYWPWLATTVQAAAAASSPASSKAAADLSSGKEYHTVNFYEHSSGIFNLPVSIMRLSKILKRAKRVIGLSGTALQNETHNLNDPLFFEIPSSQNPAVFGTKIQEDKAVPLQDTSAIVCQQKLQLDIVKKEEDVFTVNEAVIRRYCQEIISDIKATREPVQNDSGSYQRPILIFANPYFRYKTSPTSAVKKLWDTLKTALQEARIPIQELTKDVLDADLQEIARSGKVTMTTIKYGRGADIRVSLDIEEGLHVIVATPVLHVRLLNQLIGRTGRMGRRGSYSAITIGDLIMPPSSQQTTLSDFYSALHELTRFFVNAVTNSPYSEENCKRWLLLLGNAYSTRTNSQKIKKGNAQAICQSHFEDGPILPKYFEP